MFVRVLSAFSNECREDRPIDFSFRENHVYRGWLALLSSFFFFWGPNVTEKADEPARHIDAPAPPLFYRTDLSPRLRLLLPVHPPAQCVVSCAAASCGGPLRADAPA